jgi:hypothetical protein
MIRKCGSLREFRGLSQEPHAFKRGSLSKRPNQLASFWIQKVDRVVCVSTGKNLTIRTEDKRYNRPRLPRQGF